MKESKISQRFEEVIADMRDSGGNRQLLQHLGEIRDAVSSLQDAGMDASLIVRPGEYECPVPRDGNGHVLANGTALLDGLKVDFIIQSVSGDNCLRAFAGKLMVAYEYLRYDTDVKTVFTDALLKAKAKFQLMEEFNVEASGNVTTSKAIPVSPPLKLKSKPDLSL